MLLLEAMFVMSFLEGVDSNCVDTSGNASLGHSARLQHWLHTAAGEPKVGRVFAERQVIARWMKRR
ncbi:MAG: hypothetical protein H6842_06375 [Rhodospirillaceae bacterium]|nr:hypothetical protein [Rhodospirillaceae bacterium]